MQMITRTALSGKKEEEKKKRDFIFIQSRPQKLTTHAHARVLAYNNEQRTRLVL